MNPALVYGNAQDSGGGGFGNGVGGWLRMPFNASGSAFNWVMFVGVLVIAAFLWQTLLILMVKEV